MGLGGKEESLKGVGGEILFELISVLSGTLESKNTNLICIRRTCACCNASDSLKKFLIYHAFCCLAPT